MGSIRGNFASKKVAAVFVVVVLVLAGSLAAIYVNLSSENASLSSKIVELQRTVSNMQTSLNMSTTVDELQTTIDELQAQIRDLQSDLTNLTQLQTPSAAEVYNQTHASVVEITTDTGGYATGFVYDSQGYIVTNRHVVQGSVEFNATFPDGTTEPAQLVGTSVVYSDLALLKVNSLPSGVKPLPIRNSTSLVAGETAYAIGNQLELPNTMTVGIISHLERTTLVLNPNNATGNYTMPDIIQFDAAINGGESGGPLLDDGGNVIGVCFRIDIDDLPASGFIGVAFAVPSMMVMRVIPALQTVGHYDHPWAGVELDWQYTDGAYVTAVVPDGPATKAGLQAGDAIQQVNGTRIGNGVDFITYLERYTSPNDQVTLQISHVTDKTVTLAARPTTQTSP